LHRITQGIGEYLKDIFFKYETYKIPIVYLEMNFNIKINNMYQVKNTNSNNIYAWGEFCQVAQQALWYL